jgi:ABC-type dipeptide/oligopeptide/nickel transport system permease component
MKVSSEGAQKAARMLLGITWRVVSAIVVMVALVFFIALLMELGRVGDFRALAAVFPRAAGFTVDYLRGLVRGDLGVIASGPLSLAAKPVAAELRRALPLSLGLLATALALAAVVGLALGTGAALLRTSRFSGALLFASVLGISTPSFFAAMLLIWLGVWLYQATGTHFFPIAGFGWDAHLILPTLVLAARPAAAVTRLSCNALVEVLEADYIRTATAKGLGPRVVLLRHVLRNAGVPVLTTLGVSLRFSLAILPIVEYIFNWPGIGRILLTAIQIQDTVTVIGMTLPLVLLFVLVNLLLEILYPLIDPRLQDAEVGAV